MSTSIYEVFCQIAELRSLTRAGEKLGVAPSTLSKQLASLEKELNTTLLHRTTRSISLTQTGQMFYQTSKRICEEQNLLKQAIADLEVNPTGLIRLTTTPAYARKVLSKVLAAFSERYPEIRFELHLTDQNIDLIDAGIDIAIRQGMLKDSRLRVRRLSSHAMILCAAPAYVHQYGEPEDIDALGGRHLLTDPDLVFVESMRQDYFPTLNLNAENIRVSANDVTTLYEMAKAGMGICLLPDYLIREDLETGELVRILPKLHLPTRELSLLYPDSDYLPKRVRLFIDFVTDIYR